SIAAKIAAKVARYGRNKLVIKENIRIVSRSQLPNEGGAPGRTPHDGKEFNSECVRCPTARTLFAYGAKYPVFARIFIASSLGLIPIFRKVPSRALFVG